MSTRKIGIQISFLALLIFAAVWWLRGTTDNIYRATGTVVGFGSDDVTVFIAHGPVPNLMPAMTMPFTVSEPDELAGLGLQDSVTFEIRLSDGNTYAADFSILKSGIGQRSSHSHIGPAVGDTIPLIVLTDLNKQKFLLGKSGDAATVITFIYTRCPLPDYCPLMSRRFQAIQQPLLEQSGGRAGLLSISFDTDYDTPEVLREYARRYTRDTDSWQFATGEPDQIRTATEFFGVSFESNGIQIDHNLSTALIDSVGIVRDVWSGNNWTEDMVLESVQRLLAGHI